MTIVPTTYWRFVQHSGNIFHVTGTADVLVMSGYSGNGASENNPADQYIRLHGPLPQGWYTINSPEVFKGMPCSMRLDPDADNDMQGRGGFLIHNGIFNGPKGMSSEGCICVPIQGRQEIASSGITRLQVVA